MFINEQDARLLGWKDGEKMSYVDATVAPLGYKPLLDK